MQTLKVNTPDFIRVIDCEARSDENRPATPAEARAEPRRGAPEAAAPSQPAPHPDLSSILGSPKFFYRWGRLLSATLIRLRTKFDGDFDQYLIYMVFVLTELSRRSQASTAGDRQSPFAPKSVGLNTLSIADITEIPRETVRRKLGHLVESGYLRRHPNQLYYLGERYDPDEFLLDLAPLFNDCPSA